MPSEREFWSDDEDLGIPLVKKTMSHSKYSELKSVLHVQYNSGARNKQHDKFFKIRRLLETVKATFIQ